MNELALFTGAGGGLLATKWLLGWKTVCYVEKADYPVGVIKARIQDGLLDDAPIWDDANTFNGKPWRGSVDIITAGFPCQPFSLAGKRQGETDLRNGWPATIRIINEVRPEFILLENSSALVTYEYTRIIFGGLAQAGYDAEWDCLSAKAAGAPHQRKRLWIVAHTAISGRERNGGNTRGRRDGFKDGIPISDSKIARLADWSSFRQKEESQERKISLLRPERYSSTWWAAEPGMGRMVDGLAHRVDRIKAIGNGQVPAVVKSAWTLLSERRTGS